MNQRLLSLFILFISINTLSQIPDNYYQTTEGKTNFELKTALYNIIKNHTDIGYAALWNAYPKTDSRNVNEVWDIYSDVSGGTPAYIYTYTTDQCGNYAQEGDCYNREHSFPKSWFNDNSPMYSDIFHVYPTDGKVNGMRGNYPYGETTSAIWTSTNGSKVGSCSFAGYSGTVFEPIDEYKGDLARSYFYMATRYENLIASWESNSVTADAVLDGTSDHVFETWHLNLLLKWHKEDPVSTKELNRNDSTYYLYQHNRNPFIDHPEYVKSIWGEPTIPPEESILFFEDFQTTIPDSPIGLTGWTNMAEQSTVEWISIDYNGNIYAQAKSYQTGEESVISWLVTPVLDFSGVQNELFSFVTKGGYDNGATIKAYVLTNFTKGGNPWDATKTELSFQRPDVPPDDYGEWENSGDIDLSAYTNQAIHIAFKYTGSDGAVKNTTTWQLDSVKMVAETTPTPVSEQSENRFSVYPNPAKTTVYIKSENIGGTTIQVYNSLGVLVFTEQANIADTYSIDISSLPNGLYIIRIVDNNNLISINKLIKK